jgi:hypothetical protein
MTLLAQFLLFALALTIMLALSRWIITRVQLIGLRMTGSGKATILGYYLLMFPGILIHELSHYFMAKVMGLKVGKFSLGPKQRRNAIELGSVTIASGGYLRDSLVGLAPFLVGTAILLLISYLIFDVSSLNAAWAAQGWAGVFQQVGRFWRVPDFWLWVYAIFVVSNAMTPSPADRQPWLIAGLYLVLALLLVWFLGGIPLIADALRDETFGALQLLTLGFIFTIGVNLFIGTALWLFDSLLVTLTRVRP